MSEQIYHFIHKNDETGEEERIAVKASELTAMQKDLLVGTVLHGFSLLTPELQDICLRKIFAGYKQEFDKLVEAGIRRELQKHAGQN